MKLDRYDFIAGDSLMTFEFDSSGPKGLIEKIIRYNETNLKDFFILSFGDKDPVTFELDDTAISNNGDKDKILATIVATVDMFTNNYPESWVFATGSTKSRTRLYRMGITKYLSEIQTGFEVFGLKDDDWEEFVKGTDYKAYIVKRKR